MNWTEVVITTNTNGIEPITGLLLNLGITGVQIENPEDFNEFLEGTQTYWDYVDESLMHLKEGDTRMIVYIPENVQGAEMLTALKQSLSELEGDFGSLEISMKGVCEEDWENNWKKFFKPFDIGEKLHIKPTWEKAENTGDRKILEIDPGSSFGTGTHETTKLCLEAVEKIIRDGDEVLDLGCGSGILSIGAYLLGAKDLTLVDIDLNSVRVAKENLAQNNIPEDVIFAHCGNIISDGELKDKIAVKQYDIVMANIVADVLKAMSPHFPDFVKADGTLIISGIISERCREVVDVVTANGFYVVEEYEEGDWSCVVLKKVAA
ncbi:MAG: 50S ribosomal protein L11 methyltransferase [Clostridia bacterium]|nr:50S ribosomal protein L11 methyltransferase [Clostridia bacterium]